MTGSQAPAASLAAVLACHDRRDRTLAALAALQASAQAAAVPLTMVVVDDASTDGTAAAVRERFPQATVLAGNGELYWCRGMHCGMQHAMALPGITHFLWLNDDTRLRPHALAHLLQHEAQLRRSTAAPVIVVGATADSAGGLSYGGGVSAGGLRRLRYRPVGGGAEPERCDVFNGNCVLLPRDVVERVGNLDPAFEHAMGDTDYALRAARAGVLAFVAPGFAGDCERNPAQGTAWDGALPLRQRWRALLGRKGLPWRSWLHFTRRHGGVLWPLRFVLPYLKALRRPRAR
jgi:GT2 family glycosyltransferase